MNQSFILGGDGILRYQDMLCVPDVDDLRTRIVAQAHGSRYSIHPGSTKIYHDLKKVKLRVPFHPQTDGKAERSTQTLEDMLRACVIDFIGSWDDHFPLIEFSYNNSYHSSIGMTPLEELYSRRCRSQLGGSRVESHPFRVKISFMRP
ncbi:uncharacterized protein [Solanum lycopersicum]|uniref:uncharacterized protein n=1 Tax=Solanum lycopersicum TaxID=4081 RepID=UPI003748B5CC